MTLSSSSRCYIQSPDDTSSHLRPAHRERQVWSVHATTRGLEGLVTTLIRSIYGISSAGTSGTAARAYSIYQVKPQVPNVTSTFEVHVFETKDDGESCSSVLGISVNGLTVELSQSSQARPT